MSGRIDIAVYLAGMGEGGVAVAFANLVREWLDRGLNVEYVLSSMRDDYRARIDPRARLHSLGSGRTIRDLPGLMAYLRQRRPRALITAQPHNNVIAVWARALAARDVRLIISEHSTLSIHSARVADRKHRLAPMLARMFYRHADRVVAVSQGVADDLVQTARLPRSSISVIGNPIVGPDFMAQAAADCSHPWLSEPDCPVIMGLGRLHPAKDYPTLVRAFARLRQERPCRLIILGEGPARAEIEAEIAAHGLDGDVALPGHRDNPMGCLARSQLFVMSSAWEGFGNVLVEALACGVPVVSTDCRSGPAEILCDGQYGALVPVGDDEAMAKAMANALDHPPRAEDLRMRAADFATGTIAGAYLDVVLPEPA